MNIDRLDHLVLTVRDVDATCVLFPGPRDGGGGLWGGTPRPLVFGRQKINLHSAGRPSPACRIAHARFRGLVSDLADPMGEILVHLQREGSPWSSDRCHERELWVRFCPSISAIQTATSSKPPSSSKLRRGPPRIEGRTPIS